MSRFPYRVSSHRARRARDEAASAWEHLVAAAEHGARRIGDTSRESGKVARKRANRAARALRGDEPNPWQWLGLGLAAGVIAGAAGAVVLSRRREEIVEAVEGRAERAGTAVETVKERTSAVASRAAGTARDAAARVREAARSRTNPDGEPGTAATTAGRPAMEPDPANRSHPNT